EGLRQRGGTKPAGIAGPLPLTSSARHRARPTPRRRPQDAMTCAVPRSTCLTPEADGTGHCAVRRAAPRLPGPDSVRAMSTLVSPDEVKPASSGRFRLLSVHAHPDDEASKGAGTVHRYV